MLRISRPSIHRKLLSLNSGGMLHVATATVEKVLISDMPAFHVDTEAALSNISPIIENSGFAMEFMKAQLLNNIQLDLPLIPVAHDYIFNAIPSWLGYCNLSFAVDGLHGLGLSLPLALIVVSSITRAGATYYKTRGMAKMTTAAITKGLLSRCQDMQNYHAALHYKKTHYYEMGYVSGAVGGNVKKEYKEFDYFKKILRRFCSIDLDEENKKFHKDPYYAMKTQMYPLAFTMASFMMITWTVRQAGRLNLNGLDTSILWYPSALQLDATSCLIGCGICSVVMFSKILWVTYTYNGADGIKNMITKNPGRSALILVGPFAMYPVMTYCAMTPLLQLSFIGGCVLNQVGMACVESNMFNLKEKLQYKTQEEYVNEIFVGLKQESEFAAIYDQRNLQKQIKEAKSQHSEEWTQWSFFNRVKYIKSTYPETKITNVILSAFAKSNVKSFDEFNKKGMDKMIDELYPYEMTNPEFYKDQLEKVQKATERLEASHLELVRLELDMYKGRDELPDYQEDEDYDVVDDIVTENTDGFYYVDDDDQKKPNWLKLKEKYDQKNSLYEEPQLPSTPWYIRDKHNII